MSFRINDRVRIRPDKDSFCGGSRGVLIEREPIPSFNYQYLVRLELANGTADVWIVEYKLEKESENA